MQSAGPIIIPLERTVRPSAEELRLTDFLLGSLGIAAVMTLVALLLGGLVGWLLIRRSRNRGIEREHPPSIHPFNA
jgi:ABC-type sulfate transport system permease component